MIVEFPTAGLLDDSAQREEALDPARSFIVEAPAGSGKTGLLVQRYLRLLATVQRPESVVAMTFTRKAAAEMKERVLQALEDAEHGTVSGSEYEKRTRKLASQALQNDKKRGWRLLDDPSQLQIQTIDSLCVTLTRRMPVLSRFGGAPAIKEDATELYRLAARRTLRVLTEMDTESQALFRRASLHFDNNLASLELQMAGMLARRDQWRPIPHPNQLVQDFQTILTIAAAQLREVFSERGEVDFTEITRAAIEALGAPEQPTDLLYWLDYRIEHLLVDEFQDTSRAQHDLLKALTEQWSGDDNHTLFLVGDPMQSIYGFREAEVSIFLHCWKGWLGSVPLTPLRLTTNFRSTPEIVDWIQNALEPVMTKDDESEGAVRLRRSVAARPNGSNEPCIHALIEDKGPEEAQRMLKVIRAARKKNGSIAILLRNRKHILDMLPLLRSAGIRYEAVEIDALAEEQHILDLVSLTRSLLHLADRVSWLACLRAPWCGLTLFDLSALAENEPRRTMLDLLSDASKIAALSADGRLRALRIQETFAAAIQQVGRVPLRDLVEHTWLALGGPSVLTEPNHLDDAETYFALLEQFEEGGIIRDFSLLNQRLDTLYAKPVTDGDRIQILTIHRAKGLEFDIVLLPHLERPPRRGDKDLLVWTNTVDERGEPGVLIAGLPRSGEKDADYDAVSSLLTAKQRHEDARLLYVAMTRARNQLHLFGSAKTKAKGKEISKAPVNTHLGLVWHSVRHHFEAEFRRMKKGPVQSSLPIPPETELRRLPANWQAPPLDWSVQWQPRLQRATASVQKVTYEWVSDTARHVGTVVHELLKRISADGLDNWSPARMTSLRNPIQSELLRLGVARSDATKATAKVLRAVSNTLASERGRWILEAHREARSEWPIAGRIRDQLISGTIDRMFRDETGRLWIVDFKTSEHAGGQIETFLQEEQRRYHPQLDSYATLMSRLSSGPISLGLYFPLLDEWREWPFEELVAAYTGD
jgi:ATP-dependent exoDNAse (exonuclease V) beta subunit